MLKKYSTIFGKLMVSLFDWELMLYSLKLEDDEKDKQIDPSHQVSIEHHLTIATNMSDELGLDAALALTQRMWRKLKGKYTNEELHRDVADLRSRIEDQLSSRLFLFVAPNRAQYYESATLFGTAVNDKFPKALDDIEDAGEALALGLGTSCVMHLMRVMEVGLKELAAGLKIPYAPSWESYLTQIQNKISTKPKMKGVAWKRQEKFYRDISGDLMTVKQAWRNPTMHIDRRYSVDESEEIFRSVRALMQRLAEGPPKSRAGA